MLHRLISSGFGGQGALTIGKFLAKAAMQEDKHVTWLPSYGPEMRGGTANVNVVVSDKPIASPLVTESTILIALNQPSLDKFANDVKEGCYIIANTDMCPNKIEREDVDVLYIPMNKIANEIGNTKVLNMIALGAVIGKTDLVKYETVEADLTAYLEHKAPELLKLNLKAIKKGMELAKK